jgi:hypothetical protein
MAGSNTVRVPFWLKLGYTAWLIAWLVIYHQAHPLREVLWLCHVGNFVVAVALWAESRLLFSWQAVSVLAVQLVYSANLIIRAVTGRWLMGGMEYMSDPTVPALQRLLALYHLVIPVLLIWALVRFGYDRRAIWLQFATYAVLLPLSYLFGTEKDDLNWVLGPFGRVQTTVHPLLYLLAAIVVFPLVLSLPLHLIFAALLPNRPRSNGDGPTPDPPAGR